MIRILADDHHLYLIKGAKVESIEDEMARWKALLVLVFRADGAGEADEVLLIKLLT